MGDDGLENAAVVVGAVAVFGRKGDVTTLVADEVFVIRWNQQIMATPETTRAAIVGEVEFTAMPFHHVNRVTQHPDTIATDVDAQTRPPCEVLNCGGLMTLEILAGEIHQGLIGVDTAHRFHFIGREGIGGFHGQEVAATQGSMHLGHADVIGQAMSIHADVFLGQGLHKIFFGHTSPVGSRLGEDVACARCRRLP